MADFELLKSIVEQMNFDLELLRMDRREREREIAQAIIREVEDRTLAANAGDDAQAYRPPHNSE